MNKKKILHSFSLLVTVIGLLQPISLLARKKKNNHIKTSQISPETQSTKQEKKTAEIEKIANNTEYITSQKDNIGNNQAASIENNPTLVISDPRTEKQTKSQVSTTSIAPESSLTGSKLPLELQPSSISSSAPSIVQPAIEPRSGLLDLTGDQLNKQAEEKVEFNFEDIDLQTIVTYIQEQFNITFITDDMIQPTPPGSRPLKGNKVSFKTNKLLSKREAWDLFVTFLHMAQFAIIPGTNPKQFRIKTITDAKRSPLMTYIGIDHALLPSNDELIRYIYFVENSSLDTITTIVEKLRSPVSEFIPLTNHRAFILTDKSYNIKTLMNIVKELDKTDMPQSMSVLKLHRADAQQVKDLYDSLIGTSSTPQLFQARKQPTSLYFPENTIIIAEPRTNSLILLGTKEAIKKIETFIVKNIDIELDTPYSPLYVYQLKYADAPTIAEIMTNVTSNFGQGTFAGQYGGVRGTDKFMKPITFVPEDKTNRLIIKGHHDDYITAKAILDKLDAAQPQVAIDVLIVSVTLTNQKQLGTQIRTKDPATGTPTGPSVTFQTSGLYQSSPVIVNKSPAASGVARLLGDLVSLATGAAAGNTIITLGADALGIWGIFQALQTAANAQIVSNPFLIATNKTTATITVGETRRVQTGVVFSGGSSGDRGGTETFNDDSANLTIRVTPQISSYGMIKLDLNITLENFLYPNQSSATKLTRNIDTSTIVANKEVLALGGLIRNNISSSVKKTPVLGNIPLLGWLFKNQSKTEDKDNLLILISTRIIEPHLKQEVGQFNAERIDDYHGNLAKMSAKHDNRDPIQRLFFTPTQTGTERIMDDFLLNRGGATATIMQNTKATTVLARRREKRLQKKGVTNIIAQQPLTQNTISNTENILSYEEQLKQAVTMPITETNVLSSNMNHLNTAKKTIQQKKRANLSLSNFFNEAKVTA